jgi:hypothetical protein
MTGAAALRIACRSSALLLLLAVPSATAQDQPGGLTAEFGRTVTIANVQHAYASNADEGILTCPSERLCVASFYRRAGRFARFASTAPFAGRWRATNLLGDGRLACPTQRTCLFARRTSRSQPVQLVRMRRSGGRVTLRRSARLAVSGTGRVLTLRCNPGTPSCHILRRRRLYASSRGATPGAWIGHDFTIAIDSLRCGIAAACVAWGDFEPWTLPDPLAAGQSWTVEHIEPDAQPCPAGRCKVSTTDGDCLAPAACLVANGDDMFFTADARSPDRWQKAELPSAGTIPARHYRYVDVDCVDVQLCIATELIQARTGGKIYPSRLLFSGNPFAADARWQAVRIPGGGVPNDLVCFPTRRCAVAFTEKTRAGRRLRLATVRLSPAAPP